jgi:S1-C subfamily serine protease
MDRVEKSVVQTIVEHYEINYNSPWYFSGTYASTGSGFAVSHKGNMYIMTNAHCVHNAISIKLRKRGVSDTFAASVVWIVYECDLAVLQVENTSFWENVQPLELGNMPNKLDKVYVFGYPLGGLNVSVTKGVVSRIQIIKYSDAVSNVVMQVDAAINFGNSGGPAVNKLGEVVGVAFAGEDDSVSQNMGYLIPTVIIKYFLRTISTDKKTFSGVCDLGINVQPLNNPVLREYVGIPKNETGMLVSGVLHSAEISGSKLQSYDVILSIDDKRIHNDGTMMLSDLLQAYDDHHTTLGVDEIIPSRGYIHLKYPGDDIKLEIWRDGKRHKLNVKAREYSQLIPRLEYQVSLQYYIIMGLVFLPVTYHLLLEKDNNREYIAHLVEIARQHQLQTLEEQVIVLSEAFSTAHTEEFVVRNQILQTVNDIVVKNIADLVHTVADQIKKSKYIQFKFLNRDQIIVLRSADIDKLNSKIIQDQLGIGVSAYRI